MRGRMCFPGTQHLNLYVTAKALWNAKMDVDNLLDEYYTQFYGAAGAEMKTFWTTAETLWMSEKARSPEALARAIIRPIATSRATSSNLCKLLDDGLAKVEDGSVYAQRIRLVQTRGPARRSNESIIYSTASARAHAAEGQAIPSS